MPPSTPGSRRALKAASRAVVRALSLPPSTPPAPPPSTPAPKAGLRGAPKIPRGQVKGMVMPLMRVACEGGTGGVRVKGLGLGLGLGLRVTGLGLGLTPNPSPWRGDNTLRIRRYRREGC